MLRLAQARDVLYLGHGNCVLIAIVGPFIRKTACNLQEQSRAN